MLNVQEENKNKQNNNNIKEETTKEFLDNQTQQLKNTTSTISETTNNGIDNINEYQTANKAILEKSIDLADKNGQQFINTMQSISNSYGELQNNILNTYKSVFSRFLDGVSKSNWNNFGFPERYIDVYNKTNQTITDNTINCTRRLNEFALTSTESYNKSIEIAQKYYNEFVQNYFNFVNKIGKSYYNQ